MFIVNSVAVKMYAKSRVDLDRGLIVAKGIAQIPVMTKMQFCMHRRS